MIKPTKLNKGQTMDQLAVRVENALIDDEAVAQMETEYLQKQKAFEPKGYTPEHTDLIKRIDKAGKNMSELSWEQKGISTLKEAKENSEAELARAKRVKDEQWGFAKQEKARQKAEEIRAEKQAKIDEASKDWKAHTEQLLGDFNK